MSKDAWFAQFEHNLSKGMSYEEAEKRTWDDVVDNMADKADLLSDEAKEGLHREEEK